MGRSPSAKECLSAARAAAAAADPAGLRALGLLPSNDMFVPVVMYPPLTSFARVDGERFVAVVRWRDPAHTVLYVHLPQCATRCTFCHWVTTLSNSPADIDAYLDALIGEMDLWVRRLGRRTFAPRSALIGGGTPTILSPAQLRRLLEALAQRFDMSRCAQISCEAEPATLLGKEGAERLRVLKDMGVHRLSMGVQSFDDAVLKRMARPHDAREAREAIAAISRAGFSTAIDLIYGYPGGTLESWGRTLEADLESEIDMYQLYRLRIYPHGDDVAPIKKRYEKSMEVLPSLEETYVMKALGREMALRRGFSEPLRDFFARGPEHVSLYQRDQLSDLDETLALGLSARGVIDGRYTVNRKALPDYYRDVSEGRLPIERGMTLSQDDRRRRLVAGPLKNGGASKARFRKEAGCELEQVFGPVVATLEEHGLVEQDAETLRLTARGAWFADETAMQFYHPSALMFPASQFADGPLSPYRPLQNLPA